MREATHEEQQSVNDYVESISVDTGVNFFKIIAKINRKSIEIQGVNPVKEVKEAEEEKEKEGATNENYF